MITETVQRNIVGAPAAPGPSRTAQEHIQRPPTQRGRDASEHTVEKAWRVTQRAISYAAEQVPFESAAASLVSDAAGEQPVLDLADDFLSFTRVTPNLGDQFTALSILERAIQLHAERSRRQARLAFLRRLVPLRRRTHTDTAEVAQ